MWTQKKGTGNFNQQIFEKPGSIQIFSMSFTRPTEAQDQAKMENGNLKTFSKSMIAVRNKS